jgi:hypothetical protein
MPITLFRVVTSATIPPFVGITPPYPEEAPARGTTGILCRFANFRSFTASPSLRIFTIAAGFVFPKTFLTRGGRAPIS